MARRSKCRRRDRLSHSPTFSQSSPCLYTYTLSGWVQPYEEPTSGSVKSTARCMKGTVQKPSYFQQTPNRRLLSSRKPTHGVAVLRASHVSTRFRCGMESTRMVVMSTRIASGGTTSKHAPQNTRLVAAGLLLFASALGKVDASETLSVGGRHACVITTTGGVKVRTFTTDVSYKY